MNDKAAELTAIRRRADQEPYEYEEERDGIYMFGAWLKRPAASVTTIYLEDPATNECDALRELVQAQHDRRTLLARLDEAQADVYALRDALHDYIYGPRPLGAVQAVFARLHPGADLLARLDAAEDAAKAAIAVYNDCIAELQSGREIISEAKLFASGAEPDPGTPKARLRAKLVAHDARWPTPNISRTIEELP